MDTDREIERYISELKKVLSELPRDKIKEIAAVIARAYQEGKQVFTMGNGGHASTASHWAQGIARCPIISRQKDKVIVEKRLKALCLSEDAVTLTAWANDMGYEHCFSEQLKHWLKKGDVVIGFSGSGNSKNILEAFKVARDKGATAICFTGGSGGKAKEAADICFIVPADDMHFVEDVHLSMGHLCGELLRKMITQKGGNNQ